MRDFWQGDWQHNPQVRRSSNPLLREIACDLIRAYVKRGDSMEHMLLSHCKWMMGGNHKHQAVECGYWSTSVIGGYLIPGEGGVRCSTRQIGALLEYLSGDVEWQVFSLPELYESLRLAKPVQRRLFA